MIKWFMKVVSNGSDGGNPVTQLGICCMSDTKVDFANLGRRYDAGWITVKNIRLFYRKKY